MKRIKLTQGKFAIVDDDKYKWLNQWKWYAIKGVTTWYVTRVVSVNGKSRTIIMHRLILGLKHGDGKNTDHINHNGLDNRCCNIRICTNRQNQRNKRKWRPKTTSKYKGVSWYGAENRWQAYITTDEKQIGLGHFDTELEAAKAYNNKALELFGEFACLNIIMGK